MGPGPKIFPVNLCNDFRTAQAEPLGGLPRPKSPGLEQRPHAPVEDDGLAGRKKSTQRSQFMLLEETCAVCGSRDLGKRREQFFGV
jgi:hypothetical protein